MRIAVVGNGASVHVASRSAAVAARGHAVRLVTVGDALPAPGVEVCSRPLPHTPWAAASAARGVLADVATFRPDVVHLHYAGGRLGALALLSDAAPLVVTVMGGDVLDDQHPGGRSAVQRRTTRRLLARAAAVLVKSEALRAVVRDLGVPEDRITTVRWGVDVERLRRDDGAAAALRTRLGLASTDRVLLSPRLLKPLYNVHLAVEAMAAIVARVPQARLVVTEYGADREYRARVAALARDLGVADRVAFVGLLSAADMPAAYSMADVMLSVPSSDGLPQSLFESMACGTPAVLGRLAAYREVVEDGREALLCDLRPAAIADAAIALLVDPARAAAQAAAARRRVEEVASLARDLDRVEEVYRRVTSGPCVGLSRGRRVLDLIALPFA
jgi:glycosyltransferase involved in cell wall biosynthesis